MAEEINQNNIRHIHPIHPFKKNRGSFGLFTDRFFRLDFDRAWILRRESWRFQGRNGSGSRWTGSFTPPGGSYPNPNQWLEKYDNKLSCLEVFCCTPKKNQQQLVFVVFLVWKNGREIYTIWLIHLLKKDGTPTRKGMMRISPLWQDKWPNFWKKSTYFFVGKNHRLPGYPREIEHRYPKMTPCLKPELHFAQPSFLASMLDFGGV